MSKRGVVRFDKRGKLSLRYREGGYSCVPVGVIARFIKCSCCIPCLHAPEVHSRSNSYSELGWGELIVDAYRTFEEGPMCIMDSRDQVLRLKIVRLVKVLWQHQGVEEATWEREDTMRATYPSLFENEGTLFSHLKKKKNDCSEILLRGEECKPWVYLNFSKKWGKHSELAITIQVENLEFL